MIQFWPRVGDELISPRRREANDALPAEGPATLVPTSQLCPYVATISGAAVRTHSVLANPTFDHVAFPIDAVFTWVDGADPLWRQRKDSALGRDAALPIHDAAANGSRYANRDELRYSLRSVAYFAPWIGHIYLVTDDQIPSWLDHTHPDLTVVPHREIFGTTGVLPTFNSHAIEAMLHRIPGLSEHLHLLQ